jgi:hypothetical protein
MSTAAHPSDSSAQRDAGREMLDTLGAQLGVDLQKRRWPLSDGAYVEINGADENDRFFVQVHARLDPLKGGQRHAVANDVLKLTLVRDSAANMGRHPALILAMASQAAADSVRGWLREAIAMHGIDIRVVELSKDSKSRVTEARGRQHMTGSSPLRVEEQT